MSGLCNITKSVILLLCQARPVFVKIFEISDMELFVLPRDDDMPTLHRHELMTEESGERGATGEEPAAPEEEVPRIFVEIPRCTAHIGSDLHFVKLPNFLSVETRYMHRQCSFKDTLS